jgi:hypothetical protein
MSKPVNYIFRFIRRIVPLVALLLIALYLVLSPIMFTHAAPPTMQHSVPVPHMGVPAVLPDILWPLQ